MKHTILFLSLFVFSMIDATAQSACAKTIFNCNANMVNTQFGENEIDVIYNLSYAKTGATSIAPDPSYISQCWQGVACKKNGSDLKYDIYYPKSTAHNYSSCKLPVIFMIHPGGFIECTNKNQPGMTIYCTELARRGFVVFNVEYRRGNVSDPDAGRKSASYILSMYRGFQDLRGAIRSAIKMQSENLFPQFTFDTSYIFLGGAGTVPMNTAYYNQEMMDEVIPNMKAALGPVNADFYYGDTTLKYTIKGVMNLFGSIITTRSASFARYFRNPNLAPLISFHGVEDEFSRYDYEEIYYSSSPYNTDNTCLLDGASQFTLIGGNDALPDVRTYGSQYLYNFFTSEKKIPGELYLDCFMEHGLDDNTGFGIGTTDIPTVQRYIIQRVATFFQAVVNNKASQIRTNRFVNCANYRFGCNMANNNDNCKKGQQCPPTPIVPAAIIQEDQLVLFTVANTGSKQIVITKIESSPAVINIFDSQGYLVKTLQCNNKTEQIDLSASGNGVYVIRMIQKDKSYSRTIQVGL